MKKLFNKYLLLKFFYSFLLSIIIIIMHKTKKTIIGVMSMKNDNNIGNNLIKFSIYIKLKELGLKPIIIGFSSKHLNIDFLKNHVKIKEIKYSYSELREKDYDILMVNSDQTWNGHKRNITNIINRGFLKFAENWTIPRFVYGASLGINYWKFSKDFEVIAKRLLKKFSGISVREKGAIKIVNKHLGIHPEFVLDPTFLINKKYYLDLIKDYNIKIKFNFKEDYLFVYQLDKNKLIRNLTRKASQKFNYKIYKINLNKKNYIENFIFYMNASKAVITDSYHGTLFSIIFKKPFISYLNQKRGSDRFTSLIETFNLSKRIIFRNKFKIVNINLLKTPLNINQSLLNNLKKNSINFLKKNLNLTK